MLLATKYVRYCSTISLENILKNIYANTEIFYEKHTNKTCRESRQSFYGDTILLYVSFAFNVRRAMFIHTTMCTIQFPFHLIIGDFNTHSIHTVLISVLKIFKLL
jgi:hypothetical protein